MDVCRCRRRPTRANGELEGSKVPKLGHVLGRVRRVTLKAAARPVPSSTSNSHYICRFKNRKPNGS